ncbi:MAG: cytidine deaminase [Nitrospirae bacterium]|nr:MAG: cytidine deaminase [Nitrospirota bacterium]
MDNKDLLAQARAAREMAVAPSSKFKVGAALLCDDGSVFTGCNIESPTYLGICAERVALFKALSEGRRGFTVIAIAGGVDGGCPPCGACRQVLWEFAPELEVLLDDAQGGCIERRIAEYFPEPFDRSKVDPSRAAGR